MPINTIVGTTGTGKTTLLNWFGFHMRHSHILYTNYGIHFRDIDGRSLMDGVRVQPVTKIEDLTKAKSMGKGIILGDEFWASFDSYSSVGSTVMRLASKTMMQHRKAGLECITTQQDWMQTTTRLRNITSLVFMPRVKLKDPVTGMPLLLAVKWFNVDTPWKMEYFEAPMLCSAEKGRICCIPASFDTAEIVEELEDSDTVMMDALVEKYRKYVDYKSKDLSAKIFVEEKKKYPGLTKSAANTVAAYVCSGMADL